MERAPFDLCRSCAVGIGTRLDYAEQFLSTDLSQGLSVGISIAAALSDLPRFELSADPLLVLRFSRSSSPVSQLQPVNIPLIHHCVVTDVSILALAELLQVELCRPDPLKPIFVSSLVQVLAVHVLRQTIQLKPAGETA